MDKVIIYRSQTDAMVDQMMMNGDFVPVMVALGLWLAIVWGLFSVVEQYGPTRCKLPKKHWHKLLFAISFALTYIAYKLVFKFLL